MSADQARFTLPLSSATDLTLATVTVRLAKLRGTGGTLMVYLQTGGPTFGLLFSAPIAIASLTSTNQDVALTVATATGTANRAAIERIGVQIIGAGGGTLSNPTVIYVDRIDISFFSVATTSFTFDASDSVYTTPTSTGPAEKMWLNNYRADTTVSRAAITWLGQ
jgi:hypothetical protein